ncbi:hypothetical protein L208DRAFT_1276133 [Tricholoma matsutake]|nr:hypothetical protein L208DRAFT_1276133 [Tricholoma matsutake 945]
MPPLRTISHSDKQTSNLLQLAQIHNGNFAHHHSRSHPYAPQVPTPCKKPPFSTLAMPAELLEKISNFQDAAVSKATQSKDASRLQEFRSFCKALNVHDDDIFPAREDLLIAWASSYAGRFAGKTVSAKITALKREHKKQGLVWQGREQLHRVLKGVEELRPVSPFHGKRPPVTISMLRNLNRGLSGSSGLDVCIRAICLLSFFSQLCGGELLPPTRNIQKFNPLRHATFSHIAESTVQNGACRLHLPWSKTQKARGDDMWIPRQEAPLDPIHAIHKHFIWNRLNINHPIATYRDSHDNIITLTRSTFVRRVNRILRATNKGYPRITGHCFCIGDTTFYLVLGVPPDMVKKFGGWRSQAFLEYWCCLDYLGTMHIEMLPTSLQPQPLWMRSLPKA